MNATGSGQRMQGHFNKTSMQRVEDNTAITLNLRDIQERFTLWTEQLPEDVGIMKPTDLKELCCAKELCN